MRATSIFILMIVLNGFCFFGIQAFNAIDPSGGGLSPVSTQSMPFDYFFNVNETSGQIEEIGGSVVNTTAVDDNWDVSAEAGLTIAAVAGVSNFAVGMIGFLNLLMSFIMSPFNLLYITGLASFQMAFIFGAAYIMAVLLALWQIFTGRTV